MSLRQEKSFKKARRKDILKPDPKRDPKKIVLACTSTVIFCVVAAIVYQGYLETRIITPFSQQKIVSAAVNTDMLWGTYRPGVYFGLKTREERPLSTGLMWFKPENLRTLSDIRHLCEINDHLKKYGWTYHDGRNFGVEEIIDDNVFLQTSFIKYMHQNNPHWTAKVDVNQTKYPNRRGRVSLIWYVMLDSTDNGVLNVKKNDKSIPVIEASTQGAGDIVIAIHNNGTTPLSDVSMVCTSAKSVVEIKEAIVEHLALRRHDENNNFVLVDKNVKDSCNVAAVMITVSTPASFFIEMKNKNLSNNNQFINNQFNTHLSAHMNKFTDRFETIFNIKSKSFTTEEVQFARSTFSNLIGGIGYFYGASKVKGELNKEPLHYWNAPLYTAVPSRSFFPRGFLWDEGFHVLLISTWDIDIALDIMAHWFDLMNIEGWIPREQILGSEALAKVPAEFVVQRNTNANPPTLFLAIEYLLKKYKNSLSKPSRQQIISKIYPRAQAWYSWLNTTQSGSKPGSYRWRGRSVSSEELNPKTLTSGLDDFPRASHPDDQEFHVDLLCWMVHASRIMFEFAQLIGKDGTKYYDTYKYLSNINLINSLHLSTRTKTYADYGLHTDNVIHKFIHSQTESRMARKVLDNPQYKLVDTMFGYVSLFPFMMKLLPDNSLELKITLDKLRDPEMLWSDYGIRSLSKSSPLYMKYNTKNDPPYWRGQVWININYMILGALNYYRNQEGPYQQLVLETYTELRKNVIDNMFNQYKKTGYVWENYNGETGEGKGCYPFTGWSALVVMIMAEIY